MGASNFSYNHRLDVISDTSYNAFDLEAYNEGLDECDRLEEGDYDSIGDILHWNLQDTITDLKYRAEEPYRKSRENRTSCWKKESVDGFSILSTTEEADDDRKYADRCYSGTQIAFIEAETQFFGYNLKMELAVIVRSGYYDGNNIDQVFNLKTDAHCDEYEDYDISSYESAADFVIEEFDIYGLASKLQTSRYRSGICRRFAAMEKVLWQRYQELVLPYCEEYQVYARFSNGETWYSKKAA